MSGGQNALELSDEEVLAMGDSFFTADDEDLDNDEEQGEEEQDQEEEHEDTSDDEDDEVDEESSEDDESDEEEDDSEDEESDDDDESADDDESDEEDSEPESDGESEDESEDEESEDEEGDGEDEDEDSDDSVDHEAFFKQITAPFKANGKMMSVTNAEDAIKLMQMGANYNRKMGAMKPGLKVLRMLENAELMDESKLSFLIDLNKGDPAAIAKLVKDHKVDPMEIDTEKGDEYKTSDHSVSDKEVELDEVIDELRSSETFNQTIKVVSDSWDEESKQIVADEPNLLKVIDGHMASGIYDLISTEVEKERMFGRLTDVSDIQAYKLVGDSLNEKGAFDHLAPQQDQEQEKPTPKPNSKPPKKKAEDKKRREKRRAASPTKRAAKGGGGNNDVNPLSLSDEEFLAQHDPRFN